MSVCYAIRSNLNNQCIWSNFLALLAKWLNYSSHSCTDLLLGSVFISKGQCEKYRKWGSKSIMLRTDDESCQTWTEWWLEWWLWCRPGLRSRVATNSLWLWALTMWLILLRYASDVRYTPDLKNIVGIK